MDKAVCETRRHAWDRTRWKMETARPANYWRMDFCELLALLVK